MPVALDLMKHVDDSATKPALHPSRVEKMVFVRYSSPPRSLDDRGHYEMWLDSIGYLCDDLHWLLQQPHDKFWCQVVFDENLHRALDSFLRYCPRSQDDISALPDNGRQKQLELCRLVFMTFLRMSTHKESKDSFITPSVFGEILYENFLFDIPKILDICSLFGKSNGPLLTKMVGNIFAQQPNYTNDLKQTIPTIVQVFTNIASQCGVKLDSFSSSPQKLGSGKSSSKNGSKMSKDDVQDLVMYLFDTANTLHRFLEVYPEGCKVFSAAQFYSVLANFYEGVIPVLTENIKQGDDQGPWVHRRRNLIQLHHTKKALLNIFHLIVKHVCLLPVIENGSDDALVTSCIEEFLHIMTSVLNERRFLAAYEGVFVFQDDVDLLTQASSHIDVSQFEYIQSAINSSFATFGRRKSPHGDTNTGGRTSPDGAVDSGLAATANAGANKKKLGLSTALPSTSRGGVGFAEETRNPSVRILTQPQDLDRGQSKGASAASLEPSDVELESLICAVKDILPHLGDGFIMAALEEFNWEQERVISCVLEDALPAALSGMSLDTPRRKRAINQGDGQTTENAGASTATSLLDSRKNIFDHDDFDVFHNDKVKTENMHQGKQKVTMKPKDKGVSDIVRDKFNNYGSWERNDDDIDNAAAGGDDGEGSLMYNDEYDDTYDTMNVGADDADSADELLANKTMPRVLADLQRKNARLEGKSTGVSDDDDDDDDSEEEDCNARKREDFVQDPAKLREQAAQRRISQSMRGRRGAGGPPRTFDVKGGPRGQGQSKEVLHNRRVKDKNKGKGHRAGADKKMSKGMF